MKNKISILVYSNHDKDRNRILAALSEQKNFFIAGIEEDEAGMIIRSQRLKPDILIINVQPSKMSNSAYCKNSGKTGDLELVPIIRRKTPSTSIILICDRNETDYAVSALIAGISGFLLKDIDMDKLVYAIWIVNLGGLYISAPIAKQGLDSNLSNGYLSTLQQRLSIYKTINNDFSLVLSSTERFILTHLAKGLSDMEIASHLRYNRGTIRNCMTSLRHRTKLKNRTQIVIFSLILGLIDIEHIDIFKTNRQFIKDTIQ